MHQSLWKLRYLTQRQVSSWRLNEDLLDKQGEELVKKELEQYFSINGTSEMADNSERHIKPT